MKEKIFYWIVTSSKWAFLSINLEHFPNRESGSCLVKKKRKEKKRKSLHDKRQRIEVERIMYVMLIASWWHGHFLYFKVLNLQCLATFVLKHCMAINHWREIKKNHESMQSLYLSRGLSNKIIGILSWMK